MKKKNMVDIVGIVIGIVGVIVGIVVLSQIKELDLASTSFGGDFYTYAYKGIVRIVDILRAIGKGIGWFMIIGNALAVCAFARGLFADEADDSKEKETKTDSLPEL